MNFPMTPVARYFHRRSRDCNASVDLCHCFPLRVYGQEPPWLARALRLEFRLVAVWNHGGKLDVNQHQVNPFVCVFFVGEGFCAEGFTD